MKGYIIKFRNDIIGITNDLDKWLIDNNKDREKDDYESLDTFEIKEVDLKIFNKKEVE